MASSVQVFRARRAPSDDRAARLVMTVDGRALDLSSWLEADSPQARHETIALLAQGFFEREALESALRRGTWRACEPATELLVPIEPAGVGKILALGKNFREHAAEFGEAVPEEPLFFNKLPETLRPHGASVRVPSWYGARVDHEAELAVVIARGGYDIAAGDAMRHVGGYSVANDLTARTLQGDDRKLKYPWFRAKNLDGFCPLGPCLVPRDHLDVADLRVTARVRHRDGQSQTRQNASTKDLIVTIPQAIAWLSRHLTLRPGDVVLMGTPAGVGPLEDGDVVTCAVQGIGELETRIERPRA
jgi:2-keto-4-pentenoate hydratase/2-oxohepta-3-ene-1,7-dioic acid hydratase in catechol pathway